MGYIRPRIHDEDDVLDAVVAVLAVAAAVVVVAVAELDAAAVQH